MNSSIWKRLYTTLVIFIIVMLSAGGFALFAVKSNSQNQEISDHLTTEEIRIKFYALAISDSLRAILLDPRDAQVKRTEYTTITNATDNLKAIIKQLQQDFPGEDRVTRPIGNLEKFFPLTLDLHISRIMELVENDPIGARDFFNKSHPEIVRQRKHLLDDVTTSFGLIRSSLDNKASVISTSAVLAAGIIGILGVFMLRWVSSTVSIPLKQLVDVMERMRNGDFTQRVALKRQDEFGVLGDGLNRLADDLSVLVGQVQRSGVQVNITATQIAATSREQQSTTTEIAATTAEIGATSKQISATSRELDKTMNEVVEVAHETADLAGSGQTGIARMENTMRQIMDASGSITGKLAVLNEKTSNINTVVTTITKVADQTNLLSLNAAIEAEKAGEYGLGFAVVAMEIRRLADQTAVATYDIEKMVKEMQSAVAAGVMGMDKFSEEVRRGVDEIRQVSTQLAQIIHQVQTLTPRFATVSEGMHAQATGAQQISETLTQLSEAAHQTADSLRQSNLAIEQLNEAARGLQTSVARFKLEVK
jgi:methyl-accepting chemotaxis protein WspA